jgi:uncharacterized lipoprotein YajG
LALTFLSGCVLPPHNVTFNPQVQVGSAEIGRGRAVAVSTVDERPRLAIGELTSTSGGGPNTPVITTTQIITSTQNIAAVVQTALLGGLSRQGFKPTASASSEAPGLRVELRSIDYQRVPGIFANGGRAEAALKGICIVNGTRRYERLYRGLHQETAFLALDTQLTEPYLNDALSQAINELLWDSQLLGCLAG